MSDDDLLHVIKNGEASVDESPLMPPWDASHKDDQIKDVIAQWFRQKSGGDRAVSPELGIAGLIFHPGRVES